MLVRRQGVVLHLLACSLALLLSLSVAPVLGQTDLQLHAQNQPKNILFLYSYGYGSKGVEVFNDSFRNTLNDAGISVSNIFSEYLDMERNAADPQYHQRVLDLLRRKYVDRRIDLIITGQQPALHFLLHEGPVIAPQAPVITTLAPTPSEAEAGTRRIVSHSASFDIKGTLERALELFPATQRVVFASGSSEADKKLTGAAANLATSLKRKFEIEFTYDLSLDAMLQRVATLPPNTIIVFTQYNRDINGRIGVAYEVERMIIKAANAPVFGFYDFNLYSGGIGGSVLGVRKLGESTAQLALELLRGKRQLDRPITVVKSDPFPMFDWGQIKRWGADPGRLPPDTVFVNRVPTFWEQYRLYVIGLTVFLLAQSLLIAALIVSRRRRKLVELSLKESEQNLAITLHSIGDAVIATDPAGRLTRMNATAERLSGWTLSDAMGRPLSEVFRIVNADTREPVADPVQLVMAHGQVVGLANHTVLLARDGHEYQIADSAAPIRNAAGEIVGVVLVFSDVTEKYLAEEALRVTRFSVDAASDALFWMTPDARIVDVNAAACRLLGYTREELLQLRVPDVDAHYNAELWPQHFSELRQRSSMTFESEQRTKDGRLIPVEIVANHLAYGSEERNCAFVRDITERKRAEKEKTILEAQLQQVQKMDSIGRLAGGVAHDFNNMLTVILGNVALAIEQIDPTHPLHTDLKEIRKAASRSADLTRQLLAFARKQVVEPKVLDLNETVPSIMKMLQRLIGEDIRLKWQPEADLWRVKVDPSQIDQILANLCINARDAIAGVGNIAIETGNSTFDEEYCAVHAGFVPGEYVRISVSDNGHGIDKEALAHIFEPFFTTKGVGEGTGLGLATVYGVVKQNNGFINVYSEPDTGTTFTIYLPRHEGGAEQESAAGATRPLVRGQETILLVEDEPSILKLTTRVLTKQGYAVLAANTPGEAIRMASEHASAIHLLMTDVVMPEMNGRELAKNLQSRYPSIKLLFMSGYTANIIVHQGVLDKGVQFIQKPFSIDDLAAKVREVLDSA